jgi:predicted small metal-binding protein
VRVIECNYCGDLVAAANDDELTASLREHMRREHPAEELDDGPARELVAEQAYDASDS